MKHSKCYNRVGTRYYGRRRQGQLTQTSMGQGKLPKYPNHMQVENQRVQGS